MREIRRKLSGLVKKIIAYHESQTEMKSEARDEVSAVKASKVTRLVMDYWGGEIKGMIVDKRGVKESLDVCVLIHWNFPLPEAGRLGKGNYSVWNCWLVIESYA